MIDPPKSQDAYADRNLDCEAGNCRLDTRGDRASGAQADLGAPQAAS